MSEYLSAPNTIFLNGAFVPGFKDWPVDSELTLEIKAKLVAVNMNGIEVEVCEVECEPKYRNMREAGLAALKQHGSRMEPSIG